MSSKTWALLGGVVVLAALGKAGVLRQGTGGSGEAGVPYRLTSEQVYRLADELRRRYFPGVSPLTITAVAKIESSFRPGAWRAEPKLSPPDASIGLMQTLYRTARWLHDDMGYRAYDLTSADDLLDPQVSVYFGGAYLDWLGTFRGTLRDERWVVMSYNGGPGADNAATRRYWDKYAKATAALAGLGEGM